MAKPKHGRWNNYAGQASLPCSDHHPVSHPTSCSLPRFPSPAVLSALAVIATTPVVAGNPLPTSPPSFLCPFIERNNIDTSSDSLGAAPQQTTFPSGSTPSPTPTPSARDIDVIADRYVEGSDGLWRKTNQWTLYGSMCCPSPPASTSETHSQPNSSQTPMPTSASTSTPAEFDTSSLPAGWSNTSNPSSNTESSFILALAIVLAGSICVFMIGCLVWRKRKKRARDIERKLRHQHTVDDDSQHSVREKDARGKMRMWAKASARWKSNVRQSARRRRKRPIGSSIVDKPPSPTRGDSQVSFVLPSTPSRRGSLVLEEQGSSRQDASLRLDDASIQPPDVQHDPSSPVSPPTYGASLVPGIPRLPSSSAVSNPRSTPLPDQSHTVQYSNQSSSIEDEPLPYIPRNDGHVATDDKAQLARIRELASSPPIVLDGTSASTMQSVSAPEWHQVEDDLESFGVDLSEAPMPIHNFGLPPSFPPPPSKADLPFGYLDDHSLHHGDADDILVFPVSVSPLGGSPNAPPIDYPDLEPSAPSLESEDDLFQNWDEASCFVPETPTPSDQDSTSAGVIEFSIPPTLPSTPRASLLPTGKSVARDTILPRYHP